MIFQIKTEQSKKKSVFCRWLPVLLQVQLFSVVSGSCLYWGRITFKWRGLWTLPLLFGGLRRNSHSFDQHLSLMLLTWCRKRGLVLGCKLMQRRTGRGILSGTVFPHHLQGVILSSWLTEPALRLLHSVEDHRPKGTWHGELSFPGLGHSAAFVLAGCCKPAEMENS